MVSDITDHIVSPVIHSKMSPVFASTIHNTRYETICIFLRELLLISTVKFEEKQDFKPKIIGILSIFLNQKILHNQHYLKKY